MKLLLATIFTLGLMSSQAMAIPDSVRDKPSPQKRGITSPHKKRGWDSAHGRRVKERLFDHAAAHLKASGKNSYYGRYWKLERASFNTVIASWKGGDPERRQLP